MCQPCARDFGKKIAASAHGMGSGGSAVDAMVIGCLGVERRAERFFRTEPFSTPLRREETCVCDVKVERFTQLAEFVPLQAVDDGR
jgi:hypothetical protein